MPSAYSVPMASDGWPDPDTPMTLGSVAGGGISAGSIPG